MATQIKPYVFKDNVEVKGNIAVTGTTTGVTATMVGLGNVTNESKATMFASPSFTGTVSGVTATMVGLGNVTNESKATMFANPSFTGNTTLAGELRGPATFVIDPAAVGDNTGVVVIKGDLQVDGTTTTINSTTLTVDDKNIVLADGAADSLTADGAGITVAGANASLNYVHSGTKWQANKAFDITANTASTSTTTGALTVAGGVGIAGALNVGGTGKFNGLTVTDSVGGGGIAIGTAADRAQYQYINFGGGNGGVDYAWQIGRSPANGVVPAGDAFYFYDIKANATRLAILGNGNVGIGTSTPSYKIEAFGSSPAFFGLDSAAGTQFGYRATMPSNTVNCFVGWVPDTVAGVNGDLALCPRTSAGARILFFTGSTTPTERVRITPDGNFLVGDTNNYGLRAIIAGPAATSTTGSGSYLVASLADTNAMAAGRGAGLGFQGNDGQNGLVTFASINGSKENGISGNYASYLSFKTRTNGASLTERMTISSGGLVTITNGIQANAPTYELYGSQYNEAGLTDNLRIRLGTFYTAQGGLDTTIRVFTGSGYNAGPEQVFEYVLRLRTSNGSSNVAGSTGAFFLNGFAERITISPFGAENPIENFIIEQIGTDQYVVYINPSSLIGNYSHYIVEAPSTATWIHNPVVLTVSQITGNFINISTWRTRVLTNTSGFIENTRGIQFPATQSASSDVNTLDDYEEGTWTPFIEATGSDPSGLAYSIQYGRYTKVGNVVYISFRVGFNFTNGTGGGALAIRGLPFAPSNNPQPKATPQQDNITYTGFTYLDISAIQGSNWLGIGKNRSGATAASLVIGDCASTGTDINGGVYYFV